MEAKANVKEAKAVEGKEGAAAEEDLSMEEILQSIRRIITEDDKDGKKPAEAKTNGAKANDTKDEEVPGSDVFELTDMVKEDGTVVNVKTEAAAEKDVLSKIDEALAPAAKPPEKPEVKAEPEPVAAPAVTPAPVIAAAPEPAPVAPPPEPVATPAPVAAPAPAAATSESLLSEEAAAASISAINKLKSAEQHAAPAPAVQAPAFRDGTTMEDLVTEMLRPMMKSWLDANLPQIVERIVEREVRKLTK